MYSEISSMSKQPHSLSPRFRSIFVAAVLFAIFLQGALAQNNPSSAEAPKPVPGTGISVQEQPRPTLQQPQTSTPPPSTPVQDESEPAKPITKAQAKELFRSVDEILEFVSQDTGLPIKHKVKRKLITRDKVEHYVEKRLKDDKDAQRMEHEQLVLKKFGMIPQDYDLHGEFVKLLGEQVAAYYDSKTKTVNLLDWVQPELQRPVLAHELTHALQDQSVDLQVWSRAGAPDANPLPDQEEQIVEEAQAARQNVTEGQAMLAMLDYVLAPAGQTVLKAPQVVDAMRAAMTSGQDSPVLAAAPTFLQESLMMPYTFGFDFERAVLTGKGTKAAYIGVLEHPPVDTLQVMEPQSYLDDKAATAPRIPDLDKLIAPDYQRYDFGGMGAFDVYLLVRQYSPKADAKSYYSHWSGGYYLAAHLKSAARDDIALLYFSRWDSQDSAKDFAKLYSDYAPKRYKSAARTGSTASTEGDARGNIIYRWDFGAQGKVVIEVDGRTLLILEGFNDDTANRLSAAIAASSATTN